MVGHLSRACVHRPAASSQSPAAFILGLTDQLIVKKGFPLVHAAAASDRFFSLAFLFNSEL